jgi:hypothetical protein
MDTKPAGKRGRALKEAFFGEQYEGLRRKLREKLAPPAKKRLWRCSQGSRTIRCWKRSSPSGSVAILSLPSPSRP